MIRSGSDPRRNGDQPVYEYHYPKVVPGSQFLYSATRSLFEEVGFSYERPKGKKNCVMRMTAVSYTHLTLPTTPYV